MSQQAQAPAPSIPSSPPPGKDPPVPVPVPLQPGGEDFDRDGDSPQERDARATEAASRDEKDDSRSMPPPPAPNPRRTSYRGPLRDGSAPPQSPGIILTQPTFEFPSLKGGVQTGSGSVSGNQSQTQSQSQSQTQSKEGIGKDRDGNTQHSLLGEGLAGTDGTVKGLGIETGGEGLIQRPNFAPFFTLVNDVGSVGGSGGGGSTASGSSGGKTFHPQRVHYIFADDEENGVLTEALVRCVESGDAGLGLEDSLDSGIGRAKEGRRGKERGVAREREERVVIVDVNETGDGIKGVWSANPNWAVLSAEIGNAPTWDGTEGEEEKEGMGGMMLRIEGVGVGADVGGGGESRKEGDGKESASASGTVGEEEMQGLLEGFDRKMAVLRRIVASGEEFRRIKSGEGEPTQGHDLNREV